MKTSAVLAAFAALLPAVYAHGDVTSPLPRNPGPAFGSVCGAQTLNTVQSDRFGNVQAEAQVAAGQAGFDAAKCNFFMCKGYQFADNSANVQSYTAGQVIPIAVTIRAPHTGVANVSVVNTATNSVIGQPLISFTDYASNSHAIPANNTAFSVTMPDLGTQCTTPGTCVLQWFWNAASIQQTYEACIDFTQGAAAGGAGNAPAGGSSSAAAPPATTAAPAPTTTAPAAKAPAPATTAPAAKAPAPTTPAAKAPAPSPTTPAATAPTGTAPVGNAPAGITMQDIIDHCAQAMAGMFTAKGKPTSVLKIWER